jgi:CRISPR/Cas system-associated endonuclease Cas1
VTSAAIRHCSAKHIELLISDDAATIVSLFAPTSAVNSSRVALKVRELQFRAAFDPRKTIAIARAIVAAKVRRVMRGKLGRLSWPSCGRVIRRMM